jgi:hypothetical protein
MSVLTTQIKSGVDEVLSALVTRLAIKGISDTGVKLDSLTTVEANKLGLAAYKAGKLYEAVVFATAAEVMARQPKVKHACKAECNTEK